MMSSIPAGTIGTIAGSGEPGFGGDGGPATAALLNEPKNITVDGAGNLYIADSENHVVRRVDSQTGIITTVAGTAVSDLPVPRPAEPHSENADEEEDPLADPVAKPGEAYVQKSDLSGMVRYVGGEKPTDQRFAGDGGPAVQAKLNFPSAVAVADDGSLFIADTWNHRIRKIDVHTGVISTIAGTGQAKFYGDNGPAGNAALNEPVALAINGEHQLFIADQSNNRIRKIDLSSGVITTVVGTGESGYNGDGAPGPDTALAGPSGLTIDPDGNLYIADTFSSRIRKLDRQTGKVETVLGGGGNFQFVQGENESSPNLSRPYAIAMDSNHHLFITDSDNHLIRVWDLHKNEMSLLAGNGRAECSGDGGNPTNSSLNFPFGVAVDAQGQVYIADTFSHRIRAVFKEEDNHKS